jgi:hypothetical protein
MEKQAEFELGPKPIEAPGPGELLVKVEATALNPVGRRGYAREPCLCCLDRPTGRSRSTDWTSSKCARKHGMPVPEPHGVSAEISGRPGL